MQFYYVPSYPQNPNFTVISKYIYSNHIKKKNNIHILLSIFALKMWLMVA